MRKMSWRRRGAAQECDRRTRSHGHCRCKMAGLQSGRFWFRRRQQRLIYVAAVAAAVTMRGLQCRAIIIRAVMIGGRANMMMFVGNCDDCCR